MLYTKLIKIRLTCSVKTNVPSCDTISNSEMYLYYGKYQVCRRQIQEADFVMKYQVLIDLEQKEKDNTSPV